jgi:hypothetical protein
MEIKYFITNEFHLVPYIKESDLTNGWGKFYYGKGKGLLIKWLWFGLEVIG